MENQPLSYQQLGSAGQEDDLGRYRRSEIKVKLKGYVTGGLAAWQERMAEAYIHDHFATKVAIGTLASLCRLSQRHFRRGFRQSFGTSPRSFILNKRMQAAWELIALTDEPLSHVALMCGLSDQSQLTNMFKRTYGLTPNAVRRVFIRPH